MSRNIESETIELKEKYTDTITKKIEMSVWMSVWIKMIRKWLNFLLKIQAWHQLNFQKK